MSARVTHAQRRAEWAAEEARAEVASRHVRYRNAVIAITVLGAILRAVFIARQPLWRDEAFTALAVHAPLSSTLTVVAHDSAPPLAYILVSSIVHQFGESVTTLRLMSLCVGIALIPICAALGRRALGMRGGIGAAIAAALLPAVVISSRDTRMYGLATTLCAAAALCLWRYLEEQSSRRLLAYTAATVGALWTEYFCVLALAALFVAVWVAYRPPRGLLLRVAGVNVAAALTLIPWLIFARAQFAHAGVPFWVQPVGASTVLGTVVQMMSGPPIDDGTPLKLFLQAAQGVAIAVCLVAFATVWLRRRSLTSDQRFAATYLAIAGGGGTLLLVVVSLWHPLLEARYASVGWAPLFVLVGIGAALIPWRLVGAALAALLLATSLILSVAITHPDTAGVVAILDAHPTTFVDASPSEYLLVLAYGDKSLDSRTHVVGSDIEWFWGTAVYPKGGALTSLPASVVTKRQLVLVVTAVDDPSHISLPGYAPTGVQWCVAGGCVSEWGPATR